MMQWDGGWRRPPRASWESVGNDVIATDATIVRQRWQQHFPDDGGAPEATVPFPKSALPNDAKMAAVLLCDVLGALCILLNAFVIVALVRNRRRVLINVFYVLVLHCAIVDLIRGGCLIAWGMPHLLIHTMRSIQDRLFALKINQFTLVILRSCNLLTIFNLLVFTTNEFIVIKYPLHYRRYFRRRTVLLILAMCWVVSLLFGVGSVFSNFFESAHSVMVHSNGTAEGLFRRNGDDDDMEEGDVEEDVAGGAIPSSWGPNGGAVTRRQMAGLSVNVFCMLMIFVLCYVCLFTVLICYGKILRTIRQFQRCGSGGQRRVLGGGGTANDSAGGNNQQKSGGPVLTRGGSIYHKRSVHQQRSQQQVCQKGSVAGGGCTTPLIRVVAQRQQSLGGGVEPQATTMEPRGPPPIKKVSMPGTPQSQTSMAYCGRCPNCVANSAAAAEAELGRSRRCNSYRKWRSHLMSRHKYLIVIGTVLFVDILFLFPYSGIQMVALLHLNNLLATSHLSTLIRWGLQILIGVHSVCQPLCYFRMTEFRRLACCLGGTRRYGGSGSSAGSIFGAPTTGTLSRAQKSLGGGTTTRAAAIGQTKDGGEGRVGREEEGIRAGGKAPLAPKRNIMLGTLVSEGEGTDRENEENEGRQQRQQEQEDRNNLVNPSVDGQQMLLIAQRRRWTRNLSLLCKEEGEELELFLAREYRNTTKKKEEEKDDDDGEENEKGAKRGKRRKGGGDAAKGGSLREEAAISKKRQAKAAGNQEVQLEEGEEDEAGWRAGDRSGSDGELLWARRRRGILLDVDDVGDEEGKEDGAGRVGADRPPAQDVQQHKHEQHDQRGQWEPLLRTDQSSAAGDRPPTDHCRRRNGGATTITMLGKWTGELRRVMTKMKRKGGRSEAEDDDGKVEGEAEERHHPFLLEAQIAGGSSTTEMVQFRRHGRQKQAEDRQRLQPKLSNLSGLRSNSVFSGGATSSAAPTRQPSGQWV